MNKYAYAQIKMWGSVIGYLHLGNSGCCEFQYDRDFLNSGIEISPLKMPLSERTYAFPTLSEDTFYGLPGVFADSLPDKFGTTVISRYLEKQGRSADDLSVIEKLCYTGKRGMGALEYEPAHDLLLNTSIDINALTKLASDILNNKKEFYLPNSEQMIGHLFQSSSSVGGARAKALIAWNEKTGDIRSGQIDAGEGYTYWLLKFDGIDNNKDRDLQPDAAEYTKIEYAYYLMALDCGINMSECRLYREGKNSHFITKRFDRINDRYEKLHMQTLGAIAHMDFNTPRTNSYEEAMAVMRKLKLTEAEVCEFFRRAVFNDLAYNFDDHVKNISFLMDKSGVWSLSPAYDITFSYKPNSLWVNAHQMTINSKVEGITKKDLQELAEAGGIKQSRANEIIERVESSIGEWNKFAEQAELSKENTERVGRILTAKKSN